MRFLQTRKGETLMSRSENSLKNIRFSLIFQAASILVAFLTRRIFVQILSQEYLGLDGTFSNILSLLSLTELGVGSAITYSLYTPLASGDQEKILSLMALYRRVYWVIGGVVGALGAALTPFLSVLIRDLPDIPHIDLIYLLFVLNSALSYFFTYKQSLIFADQRQYLVSAIQYGVKIALNLAQAVFLLWTRDYFIYLLLQVAATLSENVLLSWWANRLYPYLKTGKPRPVEKNTRREILRNTRALLLHKTGNVLVNGTDNLLIACFVGSVTVGVYSNYLMLINGLKSVYQALYRCLTASVGNLGATEDRVHGPEVFCRLNFIGGWLYGLSAVCLATLFQPFISLWVGDGYLFPTRTVWLIVLNFYVSGMRQSVLTFRDAYGLYWHDRYKAVAETLINLAASIALAIPLGVDGILLGTFLSTMTTCFWMEPYVLFRYGLKSPLRSYFAFYAKNTIVTGIAWVTVGALCSLLPGRGLLSFAGKAAICALLGGLIFIGCYCNTKEFRYFLQMLTHLWRK